MWITSQEGPAIKIIHFERMGLNGLYPIESLIFNRGQAFRGREKISLLVYAYYSTLSLFFFPFQLPSYFFVLLLRFPPLLSFQFSLCVMLRCDGCNTMTLVVIVAVVMLLFFPCTVEALYMLLAMTGFLPFHPLITFVQVWVSFQTIHQFVNCPTTITYL